MPIRSNDMVYIDKTVEAWRLVRQPGRFFLSRPRRFGKSLLPDTLKEIFEGNQDLFKGLYIYDKWDWSGVYPVIKIDFAGGVLQDRAALDRRVYELFSENQGRMGIEADLGKDIPGCLGQLIRNARIKHDTHEDVQNHSLCTQTRFSNHGKSSSAYIRVIRVPIKHLFDKIDRI